jgi:hypothetical protein
MQIDGFPRFAVETLERDRSRSDSRSRNRRRNRRRNRNRSRSRSRDYYSPINMPDTSDRYVFDFA